MSLTNNVTTAIGSTARLIAGRDAKVLATGLQTANGESNTDGGGAIGFASGDTTLTVSHAIQVAIAGYVFAFRTLLGEARNGLDLRDTSGADTGGLGADAGRQRQHQPGHPRERPDPGQARLEPAASPAPTSTCPRAPGRSTRSTRRAGSSTQARPRHRHWLQGVGALRRGRDGPRRRLRTRRRRWRSPT